jgi:hypothetical protein
VSDNVKGKPSGQTEGERAQQVPGSADHPPVPATDQAKVMHGDKARGEVFDQPSDVVALDTDTLISPTPAPSRAEQEQERDQS